MKVYDTLFRQEKGTTVVEEYMENEWSSTWTEHSFYTIFPQVEQLSAGDVMLEMI